MSYYKRLLGQARNPQGGPSISEANDDFARMLNQRYGIYGPLGDRGGRHYR